MVFQWSLRDNKSPQVSRTRLGILAVLNNVVVWMISTSLIFKFSGPFYNLLVTVLKAPITIGIIIIIMFHSFSNSLTRSRYFFSFSHSLFYYVISRDSKVHNFSSSLYFSFFLFLIITSDRLAKIRWSVCMFKSHWSLCISFSRTTAVLCIFHLFIWSNFNFLHISQWITLPTQSCLVLYSFCANLLHSLIMWLIVSSLSPHNLHLLFSCILSILWYDWFLWRCFVLLLGEILFLS